MSSNDLLVAVEECERCDDGRDAQSLIGSAVMDAEPCSTDECRDCDVKGEGVEKVEGESAMLMALEAPPLKLVIAASAS